MKNKFIETSNVVLENKRRVMVEFWKCNQVVNVPIFKNEKEKKPIGRATLVSVPEIDYLILIDIVVYDVENRRKGYAKDLMETLTGIFPRIATSHISNAGLHLCLNAGFELKKAMFHGEEDLLTYTRKGAEDASNLQGEDSSQIKSPEEGQKGQEIKQKNKESVGDDDAAHI